MGRRKASAKFAAETARIAWKIRMPNDARGYIAQRERIWMSVAYLGIFFSNPPDAATRMRRRNLGHSI
jgi:hypothetical protein